MNSEYEVMSSLLRDEIKRCHFASDEYYDMQDDFCADAQAVIEKELRAAWLTLGNAGYTMIKKDDVSYSTLMERVDFSLRVVFSFLENHDWDDNRDPHGAVKRLQREFRTKTDQ